jgi:hypothetical protein
MTRTAQIVSTARYLPERAVTNAKLTERFTALGRPTVIDRLASSTGVLKRFYAPDGWATSDLAVPAFRDLRGYQELVFGAYVRNAMFFATLPYYLAQKMRRRRLDSHGSDVSEPPSSPTRPLVESETVKSLASLRIPPTRYFQEREATSVYRPDQR